MVFIVKIPNRSRANTPEPSAASTPSNEQPPLASTAASAQDAVPSASDRHVDAQPFAPLSTAPAPPSAAQLDILLAPEVLNHRYVRGVDKSLIVERPERIRAVLLGIATAIGKSTPDQSPAIPTPPSTYPAAPAATPVSPEDDLVARLGSLSVQATPSQQAPPQKFRVLRSTTSLPLNPPHPAVAYTHAHSDELVSVLESAYDLAKQRRKDAQTAQTPQVKQEIRDSTPTPNQPQPDPSTSTSAAVSPPSTSHAAYLQYLCARAPNHPPISQAKLQQPSPSKHAPEDSEAYTSSDGEGDEAMHASEVPEHLPQGDLYLAGPSRPGSADGGSAQAIEHAMGACCEAVDRVVAAATSTPTSATPLREIAYDRDADSQAAAPAAKRAFVLSRPPGHHCSGSTPQGFCWVNNAIVASAHAYLKHAVDRIVIFDIDLHHGNGTQNLAWRINADANKHDDARAERLAGLRAAALDRARQALGAGSGRAHASRVAKVTLTEQDEAELRRQAGPRALRIFYSSLHDIESFPCEDGDPAMIKDASTCVEGAHGQWIWNVHLDHYRTEGEFKRLYADKYAVVFSKAMRFLHGTSATAAGTLVLISAGFDACAYEYPGMQRHGKHVPPWFYHAFARDAVRFAETHAVGKLVSVLEGGYSDRALCSAALAHVTGLATTHPVEQTEVEVEAEFWKLDNLVAVEKVAKKMAAHAAAAVTVGIGMGVGGGGLNTTPKRRQAELAPWLARTSRAFAAFEQACGKANVVPLTATGRASTAASAVSSPATATGRTLRDRGTLKHRAGVEAVVTPQQTRKTSPSKSLPSKTSPSKPHTARASGTATPKTEPAESVDIRHGGADIDMSTPTKELGKSSQISSDRAGGGGGESVPPRVVDIASFLATSSRPQSPVLSAVAVTLVDALSPTHIVDVNAGRSLLPLDYLDPTDQDAPGSPDPTHIDDAYPHPSSQHPIG